MEMSNHEFFEIFRIKIRAQASTFFSLRFFLYHFKIHIVHDNEKCTPLLSYIPRAVNVGAEEWVNEGTSTMNFVLYIINVDYMCDACYVTWKYRQYRRYHVIFLRKYNTFQTINIPGARFNSSGTPFFPPRNGYGEKSKIEKNPFAFIYSQKFRVYLRKSRVYIIALSRKFRFISQSLALIIIFILRNLSSTGFRNRRENEIERESFLFK